MESGLRGYFDLVFREFDCYGTWLPGTGVQLGDIGRLTAGGTFERSGSLATRAEMPAVRILEEPDQTVATTGNVKFGAGVEVSAGEALNVLADANAKLNITFARSGAAAMVLERVRRHEFVEERPVHSIMMRLLVAKEIDEDEIVVSYVKEARSGVIATTHNADRSAEADVAGQASGAAITLARVGGLLKVTASNSSHTVVAAGHDRPLTPMYRALVFRRNRDWWPFWQSYIDIGSAIPAKRRSRSEDAMIAAARPSLARPAEDDGEAPQLDS
jgi:hypothetical protein